MKPKKRARPFEIPFTGHWKPAFSGVQLAKGDFRTLTNMRYSNKAIVAVKGMSKINTTVLGNTCDDATDPVISYTSQQLAAGGTQALTATGGYGTYTWAIISGGGSISPTTGSSTTYTAPATNPSCVYNPTIRCTDSCGHYDELELAIHQVVTGNAVGVSRATVSTTCKVTIVNDRYGCDNGVLATGNACCSCDYSAGLLPCTPPVACGSTVGCGTTCTYCPCTGGGCADSSPSCTSGCKNCTLLGGGQTVSSAPGTYDVRSAEQLAAGCCPAMLL